MPLAAELALGNCEVLWPACAAVADAMTAITIDATVFFISISPFRPQEEFPGCDRKLDER